MSEISNFNNTKIVFLVDTDIQLLNALYFILSHGLKGKTDVIIQMKSRNRGTRIDLLKSSGIFNNIYTLKLDNHHFAEKFEILLALIQPDMYMKIKHKMTLRKKYDIVFLAFATKTFDFVIAAIKPKEVYGYDDGMGSYIGDPFCDNYKKMYLYMRKLLGREYKVHEVFLNNPSCFNGLNSVNIHPLRQNIAESDVRLLYDIFEHKQKKRIECIMFFFLNQAVTDLPDYIVMEKNLVDELDRISEGDFILRFHPSEKRRDIYSIYNDKIDASNDMWELWCKDIVEDSVLVGFFSTAQFSPKLIYNREPYLIFTFKLIKGLDEKKKRVFERYVEYFKSKYKNKEKIFIPSTIDEYIYNLQCIRIQRC